MQNLKVFFNFANKYLLQNHLRWFEEAKGRAFTLITRCILEYNTTNVKNSTFLAGVPGVLKE
jgi:hypothetical protein